MLQLSMTAVGLDHLPALFGEFPEELSDLHGAIVETRGGIIVVI